MGVNIEVELRVTISNVADESVLEERGGLENWVRELLNEEGLGGLDDLGARGNVEYDTEILAIRRVVNEEP